jgi:hypothetical protein
MQQDQLSAVFTAFTQWLKNKKELSVSVMNLTGKLVPAQNNLT